MTANSRNSAEIGIFASRRLPGFTIKEFRQPAHRRLPWHEHAHASICYVARGAYAEQVRSRVQECPAQAMIFKPAAERHADVFGRAGARCLLVEVLPGRLEGSEPFSELTARPALVRSARLAALGHRLYGELAEWDSASPLAAEGLILEVLADAARSVRDEPGPREPVWLRRAREIVHEQVHVDSSEPLTLSALAEAAGVHASHFARTFRKVHGRTVGDYVRALRVERAARQLTDTDSTLSEVSLRFGFFDQSHFARVFTRHMGMTPGDFRARARRSR